MPTQGSSVVVLDDQNDVLLVLREDARVWVLPGGTLEPGETYERAAVREVREETGYRIALTHLVGQYWRPQYPHGGNHLRLFAGQVIDGDPSQHDWESVDVRWFPQARLPRRMLRFAREHIADARAYSGAPFDETQTFSGAQLLLMRTFIALRTLRNRVVRRP